MVVARAAEELLELRERVDLAGAAAGSGERRGHALAGVAILVGRGVDAGPAVERVAAAGADDDVVAAEAVERVGALVAPEAVVAAAAVEVLGDDVVALRAAAGAVVGLAVERDVDARAARRRRTPCRCPARRSACWRRRRR